MTKNARVLCHKRAKYPEHLIPKKKNDSNTQPTLSRGNKKRLLINEVHKLIYRNINDTEWLSTKYSAVDLRCDVYFNSIFSSVIYAC